MDYKLFFIYTFFFISCYQPTFYSFFSQKKTIEIGEFIEKINLPGRSISFDFKKSLETYIIKHGYSNLVLENGNIILEGIFLNCTINNSFKKIQIITKIFYKDNLDPKKNWEKNFTISENYYKEDNIFLDKTIDEIIKKLTIKVYNNIIL
ncbi:hypothetical protein [Blattabacterium cuenoti]|uniref:hypothetical protein n=1 Tax=Blattabacterium cuenoti TaxID=1653831 RepID=UPI00163B8A49|nr:hypothetical protein [Blattabacterium cuenoti]